MCSLGGIKEDWLLLPLSRPLDVVIIPQSQHWESQLHLLTYLMKCRWKNLHDSLNQSKESKLKFPVLICWSCWCKTVEFGHELFQHGLCIYWGWSKALCSEQFLRWLRRGWIRSIKSCCLVYYIGRIKMVGKKKKKRKKERRYIAKFCHLVSRYKIPYLINSIDSDCKQLQSNQITHS